MPPAPPAATPAIPALAPPSTVPTGGSDGGGCGLGGIGLLQAVAAALAAPRRTAAWPLLALALLTGAAAAAEGGTRPCTLAVDGLERSYLLFLPGAPPAPAPLAVVIMLHGGGGSGEAARIETGWDRKAAEEGFIAVFPEALPRDPSRPARFRDNPRIWNDGRAAFAEAAANDDVGFIAGLIDELLARHRADPRRVFVTGFSNGSSMAYRVGYELAPRIAAIAPISSTGLRILGAELACPVPLFSSHGTADPRSPFAGGARPVGRGRMDEAPAPAEMVARWAAMIGCAAAPETTLPAEGVTETAYRGPGRRIDAVFCAIDGAGHTWPGGRSLLPASLVGARSGALDATARIWAFFLDHAKP